MLQPLPCSVAAALVTLILTLFPDLPAHQGQVHGPEGPIAGARVRIKGTSSSALADAKGCFELRGQGSRITAASPGFYIGGVPIGAEALRLRLTPLPKVDDPTYRWVDPSPRAGQPRNCGNCHAAIHEEWQGSAHGKAGKNRHFLSLYDGSDWHGRPGAGWSLLQENPFASQVCSACHAPSVPFDHAGFADFRRLDGVHAQGVHCDYCHKIQDASIERLGLEHGRFSHQLLRPSEGQLVFGPLDDVDRGEESFLPLYRKSQYCAGCHEGNVLGVNVYQTYSEWKASPAFRRGQQCQDCHMKPTGTMTNIAPGKGGIERDPLTLASHHMKGGDVGMLRGCLALEVRVRREEGLLTAEATLTARDVGHRVPTGFIDRHLCLLLEPIVAGDAGFTLRAGALLPDAARPLGPQGKDQPEQAGRFFGRILADETGAAPVPFWRADREVMDTRLDPDRPERCSWSWSAPGARGVRVRLIYRKSFPEVAKSKAWPDNDLVLWDHQIALPADRKETLWRSRD